MLTNILVALIVLFFAVELGRIIYSIAKSTLMANAVKPFSQKVTAPRKKILYLGDSTGLGVGTTDTKYSLAGRIGTDYPDIDLENNSANGRKSADLVKALEGLEKNKADLAIIAIGGADVLYFVPLEKVEQSFAKCIDLTKKYADKILLIAPNNAGLSPMFRNSFLDLIYTPRSRKLTERLVRLTQEKNIAFVSLYREKSDDPLAKDPRRLYGKDNSHPSDDGYALWYKVIQEKVAELLK